MPPQDTPGRSLLCRGSLSGPKDPHRPLPQPPDLSSTAAAVEYGHPDSSWDPLFLLDPLQVLSTPASCSCLPGTTWGQI